METNSEIDKNVDTLILSYVEENESANISTCDIDENVPSCSNKQEVKECAQHNPVSLKDEETVNVNIINVFCFCIC